MPASTVQHAALTEAAQQGTGGRGSLGDKAQQGPAWSSKPAGRVQQACRTRATPNMMMLMMMVMAMMVILLMLVMMRG